MDDQETWDCQECGGYSHESPEDVYHFEDCMWHEIPEAWVEIHS